MDPDLRSTYPALYQLLGGGFNQASPSARPRTRDARRLLRACLVEAMQELGEDEFATRTGYSLADARALKVALDPRQRPRRRGTA